jgi:hypothetical protein
MAQRFSEAAFIASSTGNFKFQNVEKRDTEKSYVSEWVNSLYGVNVNEKKDKKHIHESQEDMFDEILNDSDNTIEVTEVEDNVPTETDDTAKKIAFLESINYDPDRTDLIEEVHICDSSENYHFQSNMGPVVLNNQMLEDWQETHSDIKDFLDSKEIEFYFDWDEMITEAKVNGEITFGEFEFEGEKYFGYGYFS